VLRDRGKSMALYFACAVGILVTVGAIFGSIYKVTEPTISAPYAAGGVLILGLIVSLFMTNTPHTQTDFSELTESDQVPQKL
jgi:hypothetical protein